MKKSISRRELKQIRKTIEAIPGRYDTGEIIPVSIALPDPCDEATRAYAYELIRGLKTVKCRADISFILSFSRYITSDKPYEILSTIPLASPCIRVYAQKNVQVPTFYQRVKKAIKDWWHLIGLNPKISKKSTA